MGHMVEMSLNVRRKAMMAVLVLAGGHSWTLEFIVVMPGKTLDLCSRNHEMIGFDASPHLEKSLGRNEHIVFCGAIYRR